MVHVIFSNKGNNHLITKAIIPPTDVFSHAYTLIVKPDNTYQVLIDNKVEQSGSLEEDWEMLEPKMIKDPEASIPEDWVNEKMMDDPTDEKPADWDSIPKKIADPEAVEPEDWDEEEDGAYEIPMIPNPEYKGEWAPARIENPDYKGPWEHPLVENPEFKEDPTLYAYTSGAVGIDIWQVKSGTVFDDILITSDVEEAKAQAEKIIARRDVEKSTKQEADDKAAEEKRIKAEEMGEQDESFEDFDEDFDDDEKDEL